MCSSHGICVKGECHCSTGWGGINCETPLPACQEQCSGHGTFLLDTGICSCDPKWTGPDCSTGTLELFPSPPSSTSRFSLVFALRQYSLKSDMDHKGIPSISQASIFAGFLIIFLWLQVCARTSVLILYFPVVISLISVSHYQFYTDYFKSILSQI